ncbi:hypothetical protein GCM10007301_41290 [Azorhizobium oxalatiphilum]|uniref:Uncharacterized protein n=1 Tax=Azorhizobium oxalatiphilum TaxID=980631 RepID=A0A917C874_9HYPH|nr:hypothetical protein [Azorhizobium oxalatiphilum]GGF77109.1 hypothetical protein GCM10007301_41290 [Azorhizobium oxalatiphilum]
MASSHSHGHDHSHGHHHAPRPRPVAQIGGSALRASLITRLSVAVILCAVMWVGVLLVTQP